MSWQATAWAQDQRAGSPGAKLVLLVLANFADEHGVCWPSQETLARLSEQSIPTVQRHLAHLDKEGIVRRCRKATTGRLGGNVYRLAMASTQHDPSNRGVGTDDPSNTANDPSPVMARDPSLVMRLYEPSLEPPIEPSTRARAIQIARTPDRDHEPLGRLAGLLRQRLGDEVFKSWFAKVTFAEQADGVVTLLASSRFVASHLNSQFAQIMVDCWRRFDSDVIEVRVVTALPMREAAE